jgi:hypothetical protein
MRFLPGLRRLRSIGAIVLLAAWAVNPSLYLLKSFFGQINETSSVQANAIDAPNQVMEVCSHHQHGCPKDCFCPKIILKADSVQKPMVVSDTLHEPSLSQCSEEKASIDSPPVVTAFLLPAGIPSISCLESGRCPIPPQPALLDTPQEPPRKIPIA